jgi:hypothetical protein
MKALSHLLFPLLGATLATTTPATAHETRYFPASSGQVRLAVGFHIEPAFEDSLNAIDVILSSFDGVCPAPNANSVLAAPIDTGGAAASSDPDQVSLKVDALYLKSATPPGGGPLGTIPPAGVQAQRTITDYSPLAELYGGPGTYNSWFRPTHPGNATTGGAYGFHVYGIVHAGPKTAACPGATPQTLPARTASIDAYFVCSAAGSLAPPHAFNCVQAIQPFPGRLEDGYVANRAFRNEID